MRTLLMFLLIAVQVAYSYSPDQGEDTLTETVDLIMDEYISGSDGSVQYTGDADDSQSGISIEVFRELLRRIDSRDFPAVEPEGAVPDTLLMDTVLYPDSQYRHFYYALPHGNGEMPLFIWLHGGVSREELRTMEPEDLSQLYLIPELLEEGTMIVFPSGQTDATWWDENGEEGILRIVRWAKSNFSIDDSRIFVGGFSDGASGSFSLMMLHPGCFAGYLAFSGHIGVAAIDGERATYLPSLYNRPGIASHSDQDGLYPTLKMSPTIRLAQEAGADIDYYTFDGFEHDPAYLPQLEDTVLEFIRTTKRVRFPDRIIWEAGEPSGCDWLLVDSIVSWPLLGSDGDHNMVLVSERLTFGFYPDWEFEGTGVLVTGVVEGDVPAVRIGLQSGDIVVGFMGSEIVNLDEIGLLQAEMIAGDSFSLTVDRSGEMMEFRDRFNPPEYYWLFPRQGPSVLIDASYEDNRFDLSVNRMCRIRLLLHPEMVDFSRDVIVVCNGFEVFRERMQEDGDFALSNLLNNLDMERAYTAELDLDLEQLLLPFIRE